MAITILWKQACIPVCNITQSFWIVNLTLSAVRVSEEPSPNVQEISQDEEGSDSDGGVLLQSKKL